MNDIPNTIIDRVKVSVCHAKAYLRDPLRRDYVGKIPNGHPHSHYLMSIYLACPNYSEVLKHVLPKVGVDI